MCGFERKTIRYIAVSVDGYIADEKGSDGWICRHDDNITTEDTFTPFFNDVNTVIMGRITYNQIVSELSPNQWPYIGAKTFVITHNIEKDDSENDVLFCDIPASKLAAELRQSNDMQSGPTRSFYCNSYGRVVLIENGRVKRLFNDQFKNR